MKRLLPQKLLTVHARLVFGFGSTSGITSKKWRQRSNSLVDGEANDAPLKPRLLLLLKPIATQERDAALHFAGEGEPRLQGRVIWAEVGMPVPVAWRRGRRVKQ